MRGFWLSLMSLGFWTAWLEDALFMATSGPQAAINKAGSEMDPDG